MKRRKGFTLMELIIVVIIIAFYQLQAFHNFLKAAGKAKEGAAKANLQNIRRMEVGI